MQRKQLTTKKKGRKLLTDKENKFYEEQSSVIMEIKKKNLDYTKKSEIIVITWEHLEEQLIVFAI